MQNIENSSELFDKLRNSLLNLDPVAFCQNYLTLDGKPFNLSKGGYKPFADIYRYIGVKALERNSKPLVFVKGRQVGGTTMAGALEMYFMGSGLFGVGENPPVRIIHAFPQLDSAAAYTKTKLNTLISNSVTQDQKDKRTGKTKSYMQSLLDPNPSSDTTHFKQFSGGNHIWIESTGVDADRLRGRTADIIFFDEVQDTPQTALTNATRILTTAKYGAVNQGVQVYFGTPKRKGSTFHKIWQASSQQYFYLGCESCQKHFPLYTPESDDWEKVWIRDFIVKCTHCGREQDKRLAAERGKWVSTRDPDECDYIGFHLNQLYMPTFQLNDVLKEKPGVHPINTERVYRNEVLGDFFQGDASPITPEDIQQNCADVGRKFRATISPGEEDIVVMGIDYGAKADLEQLANPERTKGIGQSYTTGVVVSIKGAGIINIDYALKFKRTDPEGKRGIIDELMRKYSVNLVVGDIGYSSDFSANLHAAYGDKYIVSRAHPKVNNFIKFSVDAYPKEIVFERDHYIGELIEQMKLGKVRFPYGSYEQIAWLVQHCSSMELKPIISRSGDPVIHYEKGNTPNDGFMALLNAYIAYKFLITNGFRLNANKVDLTKNKQPLAVMGYIPTRL